ncbi:MAG: molybdopterin-synthase adenylyltransferase MoeB [Saprospiraceae bacterium]
MDRYQKQILLNEIGVVGQHRLSEARVLVIGAGGLGCPALQYLAAAGVGCLGIADFDTVEVSNLHRQILYQTDDIGVPKVTAAARQLQALNPDTRIDVFGEAVDTANALEILARFDLVLDGSDNFPTRYLVNDACVLLDKPLVYGSVFRFEGQVGVFNVLDKGRKTNYRDLFPEPPDPAEVADCNQAGVIGVVPGIIGIMQAAEVVKIVTGAGKPLYNRLLTYHALTNSMYEVEVFPHPEAALHAPENAEAFRNMDYAWFCGGHTDGYTDIGPAEFDKLRYSAAPLIIDVRNAGESPRVTEFDHLHIPLSELSHNLHRIEKNRLVIIFCQTGVRSITAANVLVDRLGHGRVLNLKGGIIQWKTKR